VVNPTAKFASKLLRLNVSPGHVKVITGSDFSINRHASSLRIHRDMLTH